MKHNLIPQTSRQLLDLKTGFQATLKNRACAPISEPVRETLRQIDEELELRGIGNIKVNGRNNF